MKSLYRFLTSVRVAIVLLIILIAASVLGTLVPQERSAAEYLARYGRLAPLFERLQITTLYRSVWYVALLALFALNIAVCTLARLSPKLRRAFRPRFEPEAEHLMAMRVRDRLRLAATLDGTRGRLAGELARRHYRIAESRPAPDRLLVSARKRAIGLFGSDVVHLGLLVILAGGIISGLSGTRAALTLFEGQTLAVPGTSFSLRLDKFTTEYYPNGAVSAWKSALSVVEDGRRMLGKTIEVNLPLTYRGRSFYQSGYGWDWENPTLEILVTNKSRPGAGRTVWVKSGGKAAVEGEDMDVSVRRFLPDFVLDDENRPASRSAEPNNPAAFIEARRGQETVYSGWIFAKFPEFARLHSAKEADFSFELKDVKAPEYSVIQAAHDPGASWIWIGCSLLMAGLCLAFHWPPREVRCVLEESQGRTELTAGGLAAKGREEFTREFESIMAALRKTK